MSRPSTLPRLLGPEFERLAAPSAPQTTALHALWRGFKDDAGGAIPPRAAFTFERMGDAGLLGHLFVIEPLDGGRDWRYRLLGSDIVWLFGSDVTRVPFSEHFAPEEARKAIALSNQVAETLEPLFLRVRFVTGDYSGELETMSLPVRAPDGEEVWLIGASCPIDLVPRRD